MEDFWKHKNHFAASLPTTTIATNEKGKKSCHKKIGKIIKIDIKNNLLWKREMLVSQQPIPKFSLAHHCATPLQQPQLHLCMMSNRKLLNILRDSHILIWKWCCKGVSKCGSLEIIQRASRDTSPRGGWGSGGYLEAANDLWTIALEIGSWGRSNYPPRALRHFWV